MTHTDQHIATQVGHFFDDVDDDVIMDNIDDPDLVIELVWAIEEHYLPGDKTAQQVQSIYRRVEIELGELREYLQ